MAQERAYASIDGGITRVGNAWIERGCTVFGGETVTLVEKQHGYNWITGPTVEFRAEMQGAPCCLRDLETISLTEILKFLHTIFFIRSTVICSFFRAMVLTTSAARSKSMGAPVKEARAVTPFRPA